MGIFYDQTLMQNSLGSAPGRDTTKSANKNNDNFDKAIKVKKINNIKRNVRFFGMKMMMVVMVFPR